MSELIITNLAPQLGQWKVETNYPFTSQTDDRSVRYYCNETDNLWRNMFNFFIRQNIKET